MSDHILRLHAAHGDKTVSGLRYVLHDRTSEALLRAAEQSGLTVPQGRPVFSGMLSTQPDLTVILQVPGSLHLGYSVQSSAAINRTERTVSGHPLAYAAGRRRLAVYTDIETEAARKAGEDNLDQGITPEQLPGLVVSGDHIVGWLEASSGINQIVGELEQAVQTLQAPHLESLEPALAELIRAEVDHPRIYTRELARLLLASTLETRLMNRLRLMRWQMLAQAGYTFSEDGRPITIPGVHGLEQLQGQLETATLFAGRLAWLRPLAETAASTMATEEASS